MQSDFTLAYLNTLAGVDAVYDFRCIHDQRADVPAIPLRGTITALADQLTMHNNNGYGIFVAVNQLDGKGRSNENVTACRAQYIDVDGDDAALIYNAAIAHSVQPSFIVNTSANKFHIYWLVNHYSGNEYYTDTQRRLAAYFRSDAQVIEPSRVPRLPGFFHRKRDPILVTCHALSMQRHDVQALNQSLPAVAAGNRQGRHPLGTASLAAPSLDWIQYALDRIDPDSLSRADWIATTAAYKQAVWTLVTPETALAIWLAWCARYSTDNPGENRKQWNNISETEAGWNALVKRAGIQGELLFATTQAATAVSADTPTTPAPGNTSVYLNPVDQVEYFKGCYWISIIGQIWSRRDGQNMSQGQFNGTFGGKRFILDATGQRSTDEPWKAATRGEVYNVPKVNHARFLPTLPTETIIKDELNRLGVNVYIKPNVRVMDGDASMFFTHLEKMFPNERDRTILISYVAHCVQHPGFKIPYSTLIQSAQGGGKSIFKLILTNALGAPYVHCPDAQQLNEGGGKFTGWMKNKLMIIADEIKVDDKRNLIEILKPMITENRLEMQGKGENQEMCDNLANWIMFTNYKDAIPIDQNDRRYTILYSSIQTLADLERMGMDGNYFKTIYDWLKADGAAIVTKYLLDYKIPDEFDASGNCTRAPKTSSTVEAIAESQTLVEQLITEAIDGNRAGFRNGWISSVMVHELLRAEGLRLPGPRSLSKIVEKLGFHKIGRASRLYFEESEKMQATLYSKNPLEIVDNFAFSQNYR